MEWIKNVKLSRAKHELIIMASVIVMLFACSIGVNADTVSVTEGVTGGKIYFDTVKGCITDCDTGVTAVTIPSEIAGKPVTSIGSRAFEGCRILTSITIPGSVTR